MVLTNAGRCASRTEWRRPCATTIASGVKVSARMVAGVLLEQGGGPARTGRAENPHACVADPHNGPAGPRQRWTSGERAVALDIA
jgi:hypothetical protein